MIFRIFSCIVLVLITASLYGQVNIDSLFDAAIAHSRQMEYEKALEDAGRVIGMDPKRTDVMLFMASVYAWQENYDDAKGWIERVFDIEPRTPVLYETWLNVLLWNGEYAKIFDVAGMAEVYGYTDHYNIALKKAIAYKELGQYSKGIEFLGRNHELLDSAGLRYLYDELYLLSKRNHFEAYYSVDLFRGGVPSPQHLAYIGYGNSPDDRFVTSQLEDILLLNAYRLKLEKNFPISLVNELKVRAGYSVEEYSRERYRQRFILELLLNHKF